MQHQCQIVYYILSGKRISASEKLAYHQEVDVYYQTNAWADTSFSVQWVQKTLKKGIEKSNHGGREFLLLCDNLTAQVTEDFKEAVRQINGLVWYGPPGATDLWQPVDAAYGATLKKLIMRQQDMWLEIDENMDRWAGNKPFSASERRILITQWVGEANNLLKSPNYDAFRWHAFEKTGCLITADGSEDYKIKPEGMEDYEVVPSLPMPGPQEIMEVPSPAPSIEPDDILEEEDLIEPNQSDLQEIEDEIECQGEYFMYTLCTLYVQLIFCGLQGQLSVMIQLKTGISLTYWLARESVVIMRMDGILVPLTTTTRNCVNIILNLMTRLKMIM